jgi:arginase family enzyme
MKTVPIGTIIDARSDGSYIYMSHKGILNLDNHLDLKEAQEEDKKYLASLPA